MTNRESSIIEIYNNSNFSTVAELNGFIKSNTILEEDETLLDILTDHLLLLILPNGCTCYRVGIPLIELYNRLKDNTALLRKDLVFYVLLNSGLICYQEPDVVTITSEGEEYIEVVDFLRGVNTIKVSPSGSVDEL